MTKPSIFVLALASAVLVGCATGEVTPTLPGAGEQSAPMPMARYTFPETPVLTSGELVSKADPVAASRMNFMPVQWPIRFTSHNFSARCYDTLECEVHYDGLSHGDDRPSPPSSKYGPNYLEGWSGGHGGIRNFPPPAMVVWRSKDGAVHETEVDIGRIFKDRKVRHFVPREEVADLPDGKYESSPSILLEVNDRTIRVYMNAYVPTKHLQIPGNRYSTFRNDLVLMTTSTY